MYFQRKCKFCGKVFATTRYPNQFCSQSCYFKSKRAEKNAAKVKEIKRGNPDLHPVIKDGYVRYRHVCSYCNNEFVSVRPNASFCSKRCYQRQMKGLKTEREKEEKAREIQERAEYYNERFRGKAMKFTKVCPVCNHEFVASKVTTMFCSSKCARVFRRNQGNEQRHRKVTQQAVELELSKAKAQANEMMRPDEAAEYLRVSRSTINRYVAQGIISAALLPGVTLIPRDSLDQLFREGRTFREPCPIQEDSP